MQLCRTRKHRAQGMESYLCGSQIETFDILSARDS